MFGYYAVKLIRKIIGYPAMRQVTKHKTVKVDSFSVLADVKLGRYSYVGAYSSVLCADIGKFCSISNYCAIGGGSHTTDWVSTSPVFNSNPSILRRNFAKIPYDPFDRITIGNDVWIGEHCLIKGGVKIADGAVIGMGSVVTKDVGPYEIWAGNPARMIKKRFDDETIQALLKLQWWDWNDEKLESLGGKFNNVEAILAEAEK